MVQHRRSLPSSTRTPVTLFLICSDAVAYNALSTNTFFSIWKLSFELNFFHKLSHLLESKSFLTLLYCSQTVLLNGEKQAIRENGKTIWKLNFFISFLPLSPQPASAAHKTSRNCVVKAVKFAYTSEVYLNSWLLLWWIKRQFCSPLCFRSFSFSAREHKEIWNFFSAITSVSLRWRVEIIIKLFLLTHLHFFLLSSCH